MYVGTPNARSATYQGRLPGVFFFNGNKIITTSGGGMAVTERVRAWHSKLKTG